MGNSVKAERFLTREELPQFFRDLAEALESGGQGDLLCVEDFEKIKIEARDEFGQVSLKMKTSPRSCEAGATAGEAGPIKYKALKKRMKSSFKLIFTMLHQDQPPPAAAVESFLADSRLMVTYPGRGDEYYEEYARTCEAFEAAFQAGDLALMKAEAADLAAQKGRCHAKYD